MATPIARNTDDDGIEFTLRLGRAMQVYGAPAHRLEDAMSEVVQTLGIEGEFFSTPTMLLASVGRGSSRATHLLRVQPGDIDLQKMTDLTDLGNLVIGGKMPPSEGLEALDQLLAAPPRYSPLTTFLCFGIASAAASRFFGAGPREMLVVFFAGLLIGLMAIFGDRAPWLSRLIEPVAGTLVSLMATLAPYVVGPSSVTVMTVAGLIVLVPGFTLTVAINELAQRSLLSGTARLHGALTTFLMLGFGVALGSSIGTAISGPIVTVEPVALPSWTEPVAVVIAAISLGILFRAPRRDLGWIALACMLTYATVHTASNLFGPQLGVFLGALVAGTISNLYARFLDRPAAVTRVPSMMLLVPGGLGFLSLASLMQQNILQGLETAFSVAVMAVALVTGLLISNAVVPTRKKL